jgi:hypothetical protein
MKPTLNHSKIIVGVRGLALSMVFFMMLMSVLPMINQTQATIIAAGALTNPTVGASQIDIVGPAGSGRFGTSVTALPNGNIVVTDPYYDITSPVMITDVGAVYLYNGATGALISKLTGSAENDQVGSGGVKVLSNGNYVVSSVVWNNGAAAFAGAVTWVNATTGLSGVVSPANSLVGSSTNDLVGSEGVSALTNGNYVVNSASWNNGTIARAGASTWGNGTTGLSGVVSPANSLVGSSTNDLVGFGGAPPLTNGNYVVRSLNWSNGAAAFAGAVTWGNGMTGISGPVSPANSLVGSTRRDNVGNNPVTALANGNYVVNTPDWDNGAIIDAGAVTWGNGATGISGPISPANSLVGSAAHDQVGNFGVTALSNGNYVVSSPQWDNVAIINSGAATWGNGATGISGPVSAANSLVGSAANDQVGFGVTALSNGNYVVSSPQWDNVAVINSGAATWGNGATGISGPISPANSLVGSSANDQVSDGVTALTNGNYVVRSAGWNNGAIGHAGAATWANGTSSTSGTVSAANSLVGSSADDLVGIGVTALSNGNYVVRSPQWDNGAIVDAGAATWANGTSSTSGPVSSANSLVGSSANDLVGFGVVRPLTNGNYVVSSPQWDNGAIVDAGAATWANGTSSTSGPVSSANSLVGSTAHDQVSVSGVTALSNGNYVVSSAVWDNGPIGDAGAITFGIGSRGTVGPITSSNSVLGTVPNGGSSMVFDYDYINRQLVVGRPDSNIVTLFRVTEFDVCLQDDFNPTTSVAFNTLTGDYLFCAGGTPYSGKGTVTRRGNTITLQHNAGDRRMQVTLDATANRATASFQKLGAGGGTFSLTDRDIRNDTCPCLTQ